MCYDQVVLDLDSHLWCQVGVGSVKLGLHGHDLVGSCLNSLNFNFTRGNLHSQLIKSNKGA